ncbi:hypothetical protein SAMN04490355_11271, partial [Pelosinus propionicus DSM 13327]
EAANTHITATSGAHTASAISSTATGDVAATNVQAAIAELASEKAALTGADFAGAINEAFATLASAATTDIGAAAGNFINITGTATITSFGTPATDGTRRILRFASNGVVITHSAALILPGSLNITTVAGDMLTMVYRDGVWRCASYQPIDRTLNYNRLSGGSIYHYKDLVAYNNSTGTVTGTIKITLPVSWTSTMLQISIKGYNLSSSTNNWDAELSGYNYTSPEWNSICVTLSPTCPFTSVRFGHDGTYCCILLGTTSSTWIHPKIVITDVIAGHTNYGLFSSGWEISMITDETGITISNTPTPNTLATLASPVFTGTPAAPTATTGTSTTQIATTAFVSAAVTDIAYDSAHSFAASIGYQKLSNGLILQWGRATSSPITFPIAFPTAVCNIQLSEYGGTMSYTSETKIESFTLTGFTTGGDFHTETHWFAI